MNHSFGFSVVVSHVYSFIDIMLISFFHKQHQFENQISLVNNTQNYLMRRVKATATRKKQCKTRIIRQHPKVRFLYNS